MNSLSRTLSVRFSITMFVALLVIALWASVGARRILRQELDRGLAAAARLQAAVLVAGHPLPLQPHFSEREAFVTALNRFVIARRADASVVSHNTPLADGLPHDSAALARALTGVPTWVTDTWLDGPVRSFYLPLPGGRQDAIRVVQVTASLGPMRAASRDVLFLMLGTVLLGMIATVFGANWLARSSLAPVEEIANQADSFEAGQVGQRITAHATVSEFQALVRVLNQMLERLDRGVLSQRRIIADAAHDLRTPITAMQGEIEVTLRGERTPDRYQTVLQSLLEEVNHLGTISDTLLTLARIEAGELEFRSAPTIVSDVVAAAVRRVRGRAGDRRISVAPNERDETAAEFDQQLVGLALDQLLDNAVRHTPDATCVSVTTHRADGTITITVEDDGPGVPAETLPHLFERFYRTDTARGRTAGAGMGLTVAAAIVKAHHGTIAAHRGDRGGLRVTMKFPGESTPQS